MRRRSLLATFAATPLASPAFAQGAWPARPVRIVSSSPPAGASDILSRTIAAALQEQTGQSFLVENRPGAGGVLGSDHVAKAAPDGYTWLTTNVGPQAIFRQLHRNLPYDTRSDFRHVTILGTLPLVLFVGKDQPFRTLADYVAAARARPDGLNFGSGGNGTLPMAARRHPRLRSECAGWRGVDRGGFARGFGHADHHRRGRLVRPGSAGGAHRRPRARLCVAARAL